jgi:prepilin-type N-terminal cleavage/methylation domain-containing protein
MDDRMIARFKKDESGMTLVELVVATAMLGVVMTIFGSVLASVQRSVVVNERYSRANDQARLALEQLDRELRSGNVILDPASAIPTYTGNAPAYYRLIVYTQSNLPTRGQAVCEIWHITTADELQARRWVPGADTWLTSWLTVAEDIVNRSTNTRAFELNADPLKGNRTVDVHLMVNPDYGGSPERTIEIQASLTGRNTSYNYPTTICATLPAAA